MHTHTRTHTHTHTTHTHTPHTHTHTPHTHTHTHRWLGILAAVGGPVVPEVKMYNSSSAWRRVIWERSETRIQAHNTANVFNDALEAHSCTETDSEVPLDGAIHNC